MLNLIWKCSYLLENYFLFPSTFSKWSFPVHMNIFKLYLTFEIETRVLVQAVWVRLPCSWPLLTLSLFFFSSMHCFSPTSGGPRKQYATLFWTSKKEYVKKKKLRRKKLWLSTFFCLVQPWSIYRFFFVSRTSSS